MNHLASIQDFFKSPKWGMNLLLGGVTSKIPVVGPMVVSGWHITGLWTRRSDEDPARFPVFDFQDLSTYLQRGLWPFLVSLVASLALVPFAMVFVFGGMMLFATAAGQGRGGMNVALLVAGGVVLAGAYALFILLMMLVQIPLIIRATITQDFGASFNFAFVKRFVGLVWKEILLTGLFMCVVGPILMVAGMLMCYFGRFLTLPLMTYSWHHLQKQLYLLYLSRGGEPVPMSLKLTEGPPRGPVA